MFWSWVLVSLIATRAKAFSPAPIKWGGFPSRNFVLSPKGFRHSHVVPPQELTIKDISGRTDSSSLAVPYFAVNRDKTISWRKGLCVEASGGAGGHKIGDVVHVNHCTGAPTQKWNWIPLGPDQRSLIQLEGSDLCIGVDQESDLDGASVELRECEQQMAESWKLEQPKFPQTPGRWPSPALRRVQNSLIALIALAVLGAASLLGVSGRLLQTQRTRCITVGPDCSPLMQQGGVCLTMPMAEQRMPRATMTLTAQKQKTSKTVFLPHGVGIRTAGGSEPPAYPSDQFTSDWSPNSMQAIDWASGYNDFFMEKSSPIQLEVEGEIPAELHGILYRNGPARLSRGGHRYAFEFDGDGMVSRLEIVNGKVSFISRFVRTPEFEKEEKAGKVLYRNTFGTQPEGGWMTNAFNVMQRNVSNTNVLKWGGRLHTFWEASQPYRLDPDTLETLGKETLDGLLQIGMPFTTGVPLLDKVAVGIVGNPLTAHPKIDYGRDRFVTFGFRAKPKPQALLDVTRAFDSEITIYEFDRDWNAVVQRTVGIPGFCFVHDWVVTDRYYVFFQSPADFDPVPYVIGEKNPAELIKWAGSPSRPTLVHVIPRDPNKQGCVLETPACFIFHHAAAFDIEAEDKIVVDSVVLPYFPNFEAFMSPPNDVDNMAVRSRLTLDPPPPINQMERITIDLRERKVERVRPRERSMELPTSAPKKNLRTPHRYVYTACSASSSSTSPFHGVCRLDMESGEEVVHCPGPRMFPTEPLFAPKPNGVREDDGWILILVNDAEMKRTGLFVYDAAVLDQGPLGIAWLPKGEMIPYGLHGSFVPHDG